MNTKNVLISALVGAVVFFFLGWLIYGMMMADYFQANSLAPEGFGKEMPDFLYLFIGNLCFAVLLAYIYDKWADIRTFSSGASAGLIIGLLSTAYFDLIMYSTTNMSTLGAVLVDIVIGGVMAAIAGGVIGALLGKLQKST